MGIDPVEPKEGDLHSFNRYAYGNNNPYRFVDPDGRQTVAILTGAVVFYVGSVIYANNPQARAVADRAFKAVGNFFRSDAADAAPPAPPADGAKVGGDVGCIYCVKGDKTSSGSDYVGSTDNLDNRKRDKTDGRNREGAQIVDTYTRGDREERRRKEQQAINDRGGVDSLDNRRNEVAPNKWGDKGITPPPSQ